jgi:hypothetical protein
MTTDRAIIALPRLDGESAKAHAAKVRYVTMGEGRSLEKVRVQSEGIAGATKRLATLEDWSSRYDWQAAARQYDETIQFLTLQEAAQEYRADLKAHRDKARKAGSDLYAVAQALLIQCGRAVQGQRIEGKDGKTYTIPAMELTPSTLSTVVKALQTALDLEAQALRIDDLLPRLATNDDSE